MVQFNDAFATFLAHSPPFKCRIFKKGIWAAICMPHTCAEVQADPHNNDEATLEAICHIDMSPL
jgi:hypothetical protein